MNTITIRFRSGKSLELTNWNDDDTSKLLQALSQLPPGHTHITSTGGRVWQVNREHIEWVEVEPA